MAKPEPSYSPQDLAGAEEYRRQAYAFQAETGRMVGRPRNSGGIASGLSKARLQVEAAGGRWEDHDTADMIAWAFRAQTHEARFWVTGLLDMARWTGKDPWIRLRNAWLTATGQNRGRKAPEKKSAPLLPADPYAERRK